MKIKIRELITILKNKKLYHRLLLLLALLIIVVVFAFRNYWCQKTEDGFNCGSETTIEFKSTKQTPP